MKISRHYKSEVKHRLEFNSTNNSQLGKTRPIGHRIVPKVKILPPHVSKRLLHIFKKYETNKQTKKKRLLPLIVV